MTSGASASRFAVTGAGQVLGVGADVDELVAGHRGDLEALALIWGAAIIAASIRPRRRSSWTSVEFCPISSTRTPG